MPLSAYEIRNESSSLTFLFLFHVVLRILVLKYCKSLKYSGNNKIAIIALCPYALFKNPRIYKIFD